MKETVVPGRNHFLGLKGRTGSRVAIFLALSVIFSLSLFSCSPSPPPNILFLLADDLGYADLGVYGSKDIPTPNIDRMAREGLRFTRSYSNGSTCTPTRIALLTGRYSQCFGFREGLKSASHRGIPAGVPTLSQLLSEAGYETAHIGKWHIGHSEEAYRPLAKGFDSFFGFLHAWFLPRTYKDPRLQRNEDPPVAYEGHLTDLLTAEAVNFIEDRRSSPRPFFLNLWFFTPHTPYEPPPRWAKEYEDTLEGRYKALVSHLDESIGQILKALQSAAIDEDTIVVFASDNGGVGEPFLKRNHNGPYRGIKNQFLEGGIRVPSIVRWPGQVPAGVESDELILSFDWFSTLAELGGIEPDSITTDGRSIVSVLTRGLSLPTRRPFVWEDFHGSTTRYALQDRRWKLHSENGRISLFDLISDPSESTDISSDHPDLVEKMSAMYREWRESTSVTPFFVERLEGDARDSNGLFTFGLGGGSVVLRDHPSLETHDGEFSMGMWICPESDVDRNSASRLAQKGNAWKLTWLASGTVRLEMGGTVLDSANSLSQEACSHIAFTFFHPGLHLGSTATGRVNLYVDGLSAEEGTSEPAALGRQSIRLGCDVPCAKPFLGSLANITFYNTALTAKEVRSLASPEAAQHLLAREKFE